MHSYNPASVFPIRQVRLNLLAVAGFFSICALTMLNANFFTRTFLKTEQVLSIFYLLSCLAVLFSMRFPIRKSIGGVGAFWMVGIVVYLMVSMRFGLGVDSGYFTSPTSNFYRILTAQLITVAAAIGARHLLLAGKLQLTLRILFGFTLLAAATIILSKFIPALSSQAQGRMGGVFVDSNAAGHALCYSAALGFACLVKEESLFFRAFIFAGLAMLIPCLLLTNSRSSILFMGVLVMSQSVTSPLLKQKGTIVAIMMLGTGLPVGIVYSMSQRASHVNAQEAANTEAQQDRLASFGRILSGEMSDQDTGHRFVVGAVGIRYFLSSPVIGVGFRKLVRMPEVDLGCHNTFIRIFGEAGLFCGLLYIATLAILAWAGWQSSMPEVKCLTVSFVICYSCSAMVSHGLLTSRISNVIMGICFGLLSGAVTLQSKKRKQQRAAMHLRAAATPIPAGQPA